MKDLKNNLMQIVEEILGGQKLDNKTLQYWEQCISNEHGTIDDFKEHIYASSIYIQSTKMMYEKLAYKMNIGVDKFSDFSKLFAGKDATVENALVFITGLPEFEVAYKTNIKDMLIYELSTSDFPNEYVSFYLDKFKQSHEYSFEKMVLDIEKKVHVVLETPTIDDTSFVPIEEKRVCLYDNAFVLQFEEVFQRPIYIQEYFKYTQSPVHFEQIHQSHHDNFNRLRSLFETYTGKTISEYFFVSKYLDQIDNPLFFENFINTIVNSSEYKSSMQTILAKQYKSLYDIDLEEQDITYIFEIVKKQKLDIVNEMIVVMLSQLKEETDTIISNIFKQFTKVLERPPDVYEIEQYTQYYRSKLDEGYTTINKNLESILMHTLEFHDIIKKKIKELFFEKNGTEIRPSILFDCLNRVLTKSDIFNMDNIKDIIMQTI